MNDQIKTEGPHTGGFLFSEANGSLSRDKGWVTGGHYNPGQVLGHIPASNRYTALDPNATDGSQKAAAILYAAVDASEADQEATLIMRHGEVKAELLIWPVGMAADAVNIAIAQLAANALVVR